VTSIVVPKGEPVDFEVVTERWAVYQVHDKVPVILKARLILNKVIRTEEKDQMGYPVYSPGTANPIFVTFAPKELRGEPTNPPPTPAQIHEAQKIDLKFTAKEEPWNEYQLRDGMTIRTRIVVTGVLKTPFFVSDGDPLYIVSHDTGGRMIPKGVSPS
jgi:hypothetical protein